MIKSLIITRSCDLRKHLAYEQEKSTKLRRKVETP